MKGLYFILAFMGIFPNAFANEYVSSLVSRELAKPGIEETVNEVINSEVLELVQLIKSDADFFEYKDGYDGLKGYEIAFGKYIPLGPTKKEVHPYITILYVDENENGIIDSADSLRINHDSLYDDFSYVDNGLNGMGREDLVMKNNCVIEEINPLEKRLDYLDLVKKIKSLISLDIIPYH